MNVTSSFETSATQRVISRKSEMHNYTAVRILKFAVGNSSAHPLVDIPSGLLQTDVHDDDDDDDDDDHHHTVLFRSHSKSFEGSSWDSFPTRLIFHN